MTLFLPEGGWWHSDGHTGHLGLPALEEKYSHLRGVKKRDGKEKDAGKVIWPSRAFASKHIHYQRKVLSRVGATVSYASSRSSNYLSIFTWRVTLPLQAGCVVVVKEVCSSIYVAISGRGTKLSRDVAVSNSHQHSLVHFLT